MLEHNYVWHVMWVCGMLEHVGVVCWYPHWNRWVWHDGTGKKVGVA